MRMILKVDGILFGNDSRAIELLVRDKDFNNKWKRKWEDDGKEVQILEKKKEK